MSKKAFTKAAKSFGIEFDHNPATVTHPAEINLWAPKGKVFASNGCHCDYSINALNANNNIDWLKATTQMQHIASQGFESCEDSDCDICTRLEAQ